MINKRDWSGIDRRWRFEVWIAAEWWGLSLHTAIDKLKDEDKKILFTHAEVDEFIDQLITAFDAKLRSATWDESNPMLGGVGRIIGIDWTPPQIFVEAAEKAGLHRSALQYLPIKTNMEIRPGDVIAYYGDQWRKSVLPFAKEDARMSGFEEGS